MALSAMTSEDHCSIECMSVQDSHIRGGAPQTGTWLCCLFCKWLRSNKSVHQASISFAMLLVMALLVGSPVIFLITSAPDDKTGCVQQDVDEGCGVGSSSYETCNTLSCETTAERILRSLNPSYEPCRLFYQYSCDNYDESDVQNEYYEPAHFSFWTLSKFLPIQMQELLLKSKNSGVYKKLGKFFDICMNSTDEDNMKQMYKIMDELGGYIGPGSSPSTDLTHLIRRILQSYGSPLFDVYMDKSIGDPNSTYSIFVTVPTRYVQTKNMHQSNVLPKQFYDPEYGDRIQYGPKYSKRASFYDESTKAYRYIRGKTEESKLRLMQKIMDTFLPPTLTAAERSNEKKQILDFAQELSRAIPDSKETSKEFGSVDTDAELYTYNTSMLQDVFRHVQWEPLIQDLFHVNGSNMTVYVITPSYLILLDMLINRYEPRHVHNAIILVYATEILHIFSNSSYYNNNKGLYCTKMTVGVLGQVSNALYRSQFKDDFLKHQSTKVSKLFNTLKSTLQSRINEIYWLDNSTKTFIQTKLSHLTFKIVDLELSQEYIHQILNSVHVDQTNFLANVISNVQYARMFNEGNLLSERFSNPLSVTVFYVLTLNTIVIPLSLIVQPYLRSDMPRYVAYATLGFVLSHEMVHSLDLKGLKYDEKGFRNENLYSPSSKLKLDARLECYRYQYRDAFEKIVDFKQTEFRVKFDWLITQSENMADASGIQIAYETWKKLHQVIPDPPLPNINSSPRQLFFILASQMYCTKMSSQDYILAVETDVHTPAPERVNGMLMNSQNFADAFNCASGLHMNPSKKCSTY